jgi:hypothetical protein
MAYRSTVIDETELVRTKHNRLTPWRRVLFEKLIVAQPVKKFPSFYGTQWFILFSQQPATGPYPEPD